MPMVSVRQMCFTFARFVASDDSWSWDFFFEGQRFLRFRVVLGGFILARLLTSGHFSKNYYRQVIQRWMFIILVRCICYVFAPRVALDDSWRKFVSPS